MSGGSVPPATGPVSLRWAPYRPVRRVLATLVLMDKSNGRARETRSRATSLWQQADALDKERGGDWRARARRRRGAASLRAEAGRLERIANRIDPPDMEWDLAV